MDLGERAKRILTRPRVCTSRPSTVDRIFEIHAQIPQPVCVRPSTPPKKHK